MITVTLATSTDLGLASGGTLTLTPMLADAATAMNTATHMGTQVGTFRCQRGGATPIPAKFLPGSCK